MNYLAWVLLGLIGLKALTKIGLENLNMRHALRNENDIYTKATAAKSLAYTQAKHRLEKIEIFFGAAVLSVLLLTQALGHFCGWMEALFGDSLLAQATSIVGAVLFFGVLEIPFELYLVFKIEEDFGFNKSSFNLWLGDKLKGLILMLAISYPLLCLLLYLLQTLGDNGWLYGALCVMVFQLMLLVLYPSLIMPLFNKFSPLSDGELKKRLNHLATRTKFKASLIEVMDGSKRSGHSNAFFTGFGRFRKIVLFDTLIEQLNGDEMESVLAHEIGHYKKGHVPKQLLLSMGLLVFAFFILDRLLHWPTFYDAFGIQQKESFAPALIVFFLFSGVVTYWWGPLFNFLSRKNEYQADAFAKEAMGSGKSLISALKKLSANNLSNLNPHPFYSRFYHSHPTFEERSKALEG